MDGIQRDVAAAALLNNVKRTFGPEAGLDRISQNVAAETVKRALGLENAPTAAELAAVVEIASQQANDWAAFSTRLRKQLDGPAGKHDMAQLAAARQRVEGTLGPKLDTIVEALAQPKHADLARDLIVGEERMPSVARLSAALGSAFADLGDVSQDAAARWALSHYLGRTVVPQLIAAPEHYVALKNVWHEARDILYHRAGPTSRERIAPAEYGTPKVADLLWRRIDSLENGRTEAWKGAQARWLDEARASLGEAFDFSPRVMSESPVRTQNGHDVMRLYLSEDFTASPYLWGSVDRKVLSWSIDGKSRDQSSEYDLVAPQSRRAAYR
jgi:hypothetical protein